jgi:hypothetical protein
MKSIVFHDFVVLSMPGVKIFEDALPPEVPG